MAFFSFEPESPLRDAMASSMFRPWGRDTLRRRKELEAEVGKDQAKAEDAEETAQEQMARSEERNRAAMMAKIEGETAQQRMQRLQNQAWNPNEYGSKYRSAFKEQAPPQGPPVDEEAEKRRRRRLAMADYETE